jgi:putative MATE family efflux protein
MSAPSVAAPTRPFDRSLVEGPITRAVWKLAWPTMLQNVVGGVQGIVDHLMVGHYVGYVGNAAIGVSWQIFLVVIVFVSALYTGMGVLVARFAGAGDRERVNRTVYQALLTSIGLASIVMAPLGYLLAPGLLELVQAAPAVKAEALPYLRTLFVFSGGLLVFFLLAGALRAAGDARTPLRLGVLITALNIALNIVLIRGLGPIPAFGTLGAAMGTVLASAVASGLGLWLLASGQLVVRLPPRANWRPEWGIIRALCRFGLPAGFQGVAMNVGGVLLLRFIGSLAESAAAQAAYAIAYTELFSLVTWTASGLMGATAAVAGQNLGAGRPDRTVRAVQAASRLGLGVASGVGLVFLAAPAWLLGLFGMTDPRVLAAGVPLLRLLSVSGLFVTVALAYTGGLQGTGDTRGPFYITLASQLAVPLGWCAAIDRLRGLEALDIWIGIVLGHATRAVLSVGRFRQEKWRQLAVDIEPARP